MEFLRKNFFWLGPILFIIIFAPFSQTIDLEFSRYFFNQDGFATSSFYDFLFDFGILPAWIVTLFCIGALGYSFYTKKIISYRPYLMVPILTMAIGSGLIVHAVLKEHWGRPRPKQVIEFGGGQEFRPFYKPNFFNQPEPSKSFACGHCSLGFFFFSVVLVGVRLKNKSLVFAGYFLSLLLGGLLSYIRIAQGGHFFSDTLISAFIMWWSALFADWLIFKRHSFNDSFN